MNGTNNGGNDFDDFESKLNNLKKLWLSWIL